MAIEPDVALPASSKQLPSELTEEGNLKVSVEELSEVLYGLLCCAGGGPYQSTSDILFSNDEQTSADSAEYVKIKEINVGYLSGNLKVVFDSRDPSGESHWVHARIYKNDVAFGTERSQNGDWYTYEETLEFEKCDLLQLYVKNNDSGYPCQVRNLRILGKFALPTAPKNNL